MSINELELHKIFPRHSGDTYMKIKFCLAGVTLALASFNTMAVEGNYLYAAVDYSRAILSNYCAGIPDGVACQNTNPGNRISIGYQAISVIGKEGIGLEASYVKAGKGSFSGMGVSADTTNTEWQIAATGTLPLDENFIVISKAGLAFWNLNTVSSPEVSGLSPKGTDFVLGLGVQVDLGKTIALRSMYDAHLIGNSVTGRGTLSTLSLGALVRF